MLFAQEVALAERHNALWRNCLPQVQVSGSVVASNQEAQSVTTHKLRIIPS